ncbi:MAG: efflux RND transporter permease subunit [Bdellovibrionales bacterium]|nr:efflux RND transporter permease subunit [Bdellovibrionales bacterium]
MNRLIDFFTRKGVFGDLLTVTVIAVGIACTLLIRKEVFPNVNFDIIVITTIYPGASPEEVEKLVTNKIERELQAVNGIKRLTSTSTESRSVIVVQLDPDQISAEKGKREVDSAVDRVTDLPKDVEDPNVTELESKNQPIVEIGVYGELSDLEMLEQARRIERELERLDEVASVNISDERDVEIQVEADPGKLDRFRISLQEVTNAIAAKNVSIPGGTLKVSAGDPDGQEKVVRTVGEYKNADDVKRTVVRGNDLGDSIRVQDLAKVEMAVSRPTVIHRTNGQPGVHMVVIKKGGKDAVTLVEKVRARMKEIEPLLSPKVNYDFVNDVSYYVKRRISILTGNLAMGLVLVLGILSLLLPFRVAALVSLGIPFAFLGTMIIYYTQDLSINLISLLGLIIVVGMLVDDAIVVMDNSVRLMEEGLEPMEAAIKGAQQMWPPVLASVFTTVTAFAPMLFMSGIFGKFIREMPLGVMIALGISLLESFLILPYHISRWVTVEKRAGKQKKGHLDRILAKTESFWDHTVLPRYRKLLQVLIAHRYKVAGGGVALFFGSIALAALGMRFVLFPPDGIDVFLVRATAPVGTRIERTLELTRPIEEALKKLPPSELQAFTAAIGYQGQDNFDPDTKRGSEYAIFKIYLTPEMRRPRDTKTIIAALRESVGEIPGLKKVSFDQVNPGPPVGKPVNVGLQGERYEDILPAIKDLKAELAKLPGVSDLDDTFVFGKQEIVVRPKDAETAAAGLTTAEIGTLVRTAFEGTEASSIQGLDEEVGIRVWLPEKDQSSRDVLERLLIPNRQGALVPLSRVASFDEAQSIAAFQHEDFEREVRVTGQVDVAKNSAQEVADTVRSKIMPEFLKKHPRISFVFGGEDKDTAESMQSLARAFLLAGVGIFLILVFTFQSILQTLMVMLTIPVGVIAVILAFFVHGKPLSFMGMLGIIALAGVIVNNAIVLIDFVNTLRAEGKGKVESIVLGATIRLRPIFLTTSTTVVGVLPTAYGIGGLDPFVVPIALALGWGLMFGSLLTSMIFPAILAVLDDAEAFGGRLRKRLGLAAH